MPIQQYKVLSIDAWRDRDGWQWNNWFNAGTVELDINSSNRQILKAMREAGFLSDESKGRAAIVDDQYNLVITDRNTGEPVFAIEYGSLAS